MVAVAAARGARRCCYAFTPAGPTPEASCVLSVQVCDGAAAPLAQDYGYMNFLPEPSGTMAVAMTTIGIPQRR